ncbi:MAG: Ni/Fe hydrogenase subunit alpha [Candidatus Promineifilaceae bacterium]|nr:Ni/Fe hydrogenase subunit alpha [Candidatus Promineifilaceae bacterium]
MAEKRINVDYLARVEGEGALRIEIVGDEIGDVQLNIYEPPRFFEGFLRGRGYQETVDITARICGICPVAYQMSAAHALEKALGIVPPPGVRALRRLLYLGEWIESHGLHVYMLHAPDFVGYESSITMAANPELRPLVEQGLRMKRIGNELMIVIGGREIHPVSVCVGGFYVAPPAAALREMLPDLEWGLEAAVDTVRWAATLDYPDFESDYDFVALSHPDEYAINEGNFTSTSGLDIPAEAYEEHFREEHVAHSNALHSRFIGRDGSYFVGPLARVNLNFQQLSPKARAVAAEIGFAPPENNPFKSLIARSLELVHSFEEAIAIVEQYEEPRPSRTPPPADLVAGEGAHATEAPRGTLYHRYQVGADGLIKEARIVPPTAQNLRRMEDDLWQFAPGVLSLPLEEATLRCEQLVRSYDPCISCATHFLTLEIERT